MLLILVVLGSPLGPLFAQEAPVVTGNAIEPQEIDTDALRPDLTSTQSSDGMIHVVWMHEGQMFYAKVDQSLKNSGSVSVGTDVMNPGIAVDDSGTAWVVAFRPADGKFVIKAMSDPAAPWKVIEWGGVDGELKVDDPYPYLATSGKSAILVLSGSVGGERAVFSFFGDPATGKFSRAGQSLQLSFNSKKLILNVRRPALVMTPSKVGRLAYAVGGGYLFYHTVEPDGRIEPIPDYDGYKPKGSVNYGAAFDERSAWLAYIEPNGSKLVVIDENAEIVSEGQLGIKLQPHAVGPNRRSFARTPDGAGAIFLGGVAKETFTGFIAARKVGEEWLEWTDLTDAKLVNPRVHFHAPTGKFVIVSSDLGNLVVNTTTPDGGGLESAH